MAGLTGKTVGAVEDIVAVVRCSRIEGGVRNSQHYVGHGSCTAANLAFGGPSACKHACIGLGECVEACPFDAIALVDGFPVVDAELCVGCGTCVRTCPKHVIELMPLNARVWVPCSTKAPGKEVKEVCAVGCISCRMCVKACPANAVALKEGIVQIDHQKCLEFGKECGEACIEKCPRNIFRRRGRSENVESEKIAAAG